MNVEEIITPLNVTMVTMWNREAQFVIDDIVNHEVKVIVVIFFTINIYSFIKIYTTPFTVTRLLETVKLTFYDSCNGLFITTIKYISILLRLSFQLLILYSMSLTTMILWIVLDYNILLSNVECYHLHTVTTVWFYILWNCAKYYNLGIITLY